MLIKEIKKAETFGLDCPAFAVRLTWMLQLFAILLLVLALVAPSSGGYEFIHFDGQGQSLEIWRRVRDIALELTLTAAGEYQNSIKNDPLIIKNGIRLTQGVPQPRRQEEGWPKDGPGPETLLQNWTLFVP